MDTDRLHYFCMVAQTGSLRGAAELLRVSPAALSKAIKLLESETGKKLIVPSGRGIAITPSGRRLAERGQVILRDLDALKRDIDEENAAAADRPLRVGSFEVFTTHFLGSLVGDGLGSRPLTLHELAPGHLEQALAEGQIDLGITYIPIPHADVDHLRVAQVEMGVFRRRGAFSEPAFDQLPFVVPVTPVTGSPDRVRGLDGWPDHLRRRNIRYRVTLMESALELCRQGLAVAFLPRFVVRAHNAKLKPEYRLEPIEIPAGASLGKQAVYLIKRKTDVEDVPMKKLARAIRVGV